MRGATVGAVAQPGQELFRLIRKERLEWRADVAATELVRIQPGQKVQVTPAGGSAVAGTVRTVAPTVDAATRNGVVYVDLPQPGNGQSRHVRARRLRGRRARGRDAAAERGRAARRLQLGVPDRRGATRCSRRKVTVGARVGERIEIIGGLAERRARRRQGAGFLADGDVVRIADK